jgi:hypothetical protein
MGEMKRAAAREERQRAREKTYGVAVSFEREQQRWVCVFVDVGTGAQLGSKRWFLDPEVLMTIARRGNGFRTQDDVHALDFAIGQGRGRLVLSLSQDQYRKLTA